MSSINLQQEGAEAETKLEDHHAIIKQAQSATGSATSSYSMTPQQLWSVVTLAL